MLDRYDAIATDDDHCLEMDLHPGDIQLLSNHTIVHARSAYVDHEDPAERRHLLRLWLSLPQRADLRKRWLITKTQAGLLTRLAREQVRQSLFQRAAVRTTAGG
jgi:hypothetical protein